MAALLDVNVLLALFDPDNARHEHVRDWFKSEAGSGWATCAVTQNGFVRIVTQSGYPNPISLVDAVQRLAAAASSKFHQFWPCDVAIVDGAVIDSSQILGPMHITDTYLLALATAHQGTFVTFDRRINLASVAHAKPANLLVL